MGGAALRVLRPGPLTTVQDLGRHGYRKEGVPVGGAVDAQALWLANRLVGNAPGEAGLEVTLFGLEVEALAETVVAITGADLDARVNGAEAPLGESFPLRAGDRLAFHGPRAGCRAYLAVAGGIDVPPVLGSRATDLLGRMGGMNGRPLRAGDVLSTGPVSGMLRDRVGRRLRPGAVPVPGPEVIVRAVAGPQGDWFSAEAVGLFFSRDYEVLPTSDRMGLRLAGPAVPPLPGRELPSEGTPVGSVQVPGDGQPIVLLAGCQTMGGYPKIATVITPDLPLLAQARPGFSRVRFAAVTLEEAHRTLAEWARWLEDPDLVRQD